MSNTLLFLTRKKIHFTITFLILSVVVTLQSGLAKDDGISGYTNSVGEGNCTSCHSPTAVNSGTGKVEIKHDIPTEGYTPGNTYAISVVVSKTGFNLFGFDFQALNTSNSSIGALAVTDSKSTQIINSGRANMTHVRNGGASSNSKSFNFNWTAPAKGTGTVKFYSSGLCANANNSTSGDYTHTTSVSISEISNSPTSIIIGTVSGSPFCEGQTGIEIPFSISGTFNSDNVFTAQLSNEKGSFIAPTELGSIASLSSGKIITSKPLPSIIGTAYRIRIVSSSPSFIGNDNGTDLSIKNCSTTGIADEKKSLFSLFPNPNKGNVNLTFSDAHDYLSVELYDIAGIRFMNKNFFNILPNEALNLDLPLDLHGVFMLRIQTQKEILTKRIFIE